MKTKNILFGIFLISISPALFAQVVSIPDAAFKAKLLSHSPVIDSNNDNEIQVSEAESFTGLLDVRGSANMNGGIVDLTGIEAFINITGLNCRWNEITSLDTSSNLELQTIICYANEISSIDVSSNIQLTGLFVSDNQLTEIDISNNINLVDFAGSFNSFTTIDFTNNTVLEVIECYVCELDYVTLGVLPSLEVLLLPNNNLEDLNLNGLNALRLLIIRFNNFESLNTMQNSALESIIIHDNNLVSLDFSENEILQVIHCHNNPFLENINLINGNNVNMDTSKNSPNNFTNLPLLETVCLDESESDLAGFILEQVGHEVTFLEQCSLGIPAEQQTIVSIHPNPVNELLMIENNGIHLEYRLHDLNGILVLQGEINETRNNEIDVSSIEKGFYFITIRTQDGDKSISKVIKN